MTDFSASPEVRHERAWKCGSAYKYPLPTAEVDPWTQLLKPLQEKDAERCKVWKDEVSNILIFAGLFSAVVTAFIIESYKSLRKDPVEVMLEYLVANRIGVSNDTTSPFTTDSFSLPESSSTRINTVWFLSLVLSLATVLIGTIALQWVREHERNHGELEPQIAFSLHRMQVDSLDRWLVPHTFALLSLLLLAAVVLFLLGLVELLWLMNRTVGGWVGAVVALALLFLALTTVLPTCQAILLFLPFRFASQSPRTPCPYKSPQAWAFHHLCSPIVKLIAQFGEKSDKYANIDSRNLTSDRGRADWVETLPHGTGILFRNKLGDSWLEHGVGWLYQRDFDFMKADAGFVANTHFSKLPIPLYDAVQGLLDAKQTTFVTHANYTAVDHGIGVALSANETVPGIAGPYGRFLHRLSLSEPLVFGIPPGVETDECDVLQDDATLRLFSRNNGMDNLPSGAEQRGMEICLRLTEWLYGRNLSTLYKHPHDPYGGLPPQTLPIQWVVHILENRSVDSKCVKRLQRQTRLILVRFFQRVKTVNTMDTPLRSTMDTNEYVGRFLAATGRILTFEGDDDLEVCDEILGILGEDGTTYYGFQAALSLCHSILIRAQCLSPPLARLISTLCDYETATGKLRHPYLPPPNFNWGQFVDMARALGMDSLEVDARDSGFFTPSEHSYTRDSTYSAIVVTPR